MHPARAMCATCSIALKALVTSKCAPPPRCAQSIQDDLESLLCDGNQMSTRELVAVQISLEEWDAHLTVTASAPRHA